MGIPVTESSLNSKIHLTVGKVVIIVFCCCLMKMHDPVLSNFTLAKYYIMPRQRCKPPKMPVPLDAPERPGTLRIQDQRCSISTFTPMAMSTSPPASSAQDSNRAPR